MAERTGDRGWYDFAGAMFGHRRCVQRHPGALGGHEEGVLRGRNAVYDNLQFWGWAWLIIGVVQIGAAIMLFSGQGRMLGIVLAALSAVVSFTSLGASPAWSIIVIAMDVLIIHGLTVHAHR